MSSSQNLSSHPTHSRLEGGHGSNRKWTKLMPQSAHPSIHLSNQPSVCLSIHPSTHLSIHRIDMAARLLKSNSGWHMQQLTSLTQAIGHVSPKPGRQEWNRQQRNCLPSCCTGISFCSFPFPFFLFALPFQLERCKERMGL